LTCRFADRLGRTPLHEAVESESKAAVPKVIQTMIKMIHKANNWLLLDAKDNDGNTALHLAARRGHLGVIRELGALDPTKRNSVKDTPFIIAARAGHPGLVEAMIQVSNTIVFPRHYRIRKS